MSEESVVQLKHPVTYTADRIDGGGERTLEEIHVPHRIKAKHLRAIDAATGEVAKSLALLAAVTGLPKVAIDELDAEDVAAATEALAVPFSGPRWTGTMPSD